MFPTVRRHGAADSCASPSKAEEMVRWRIAELLEERNWAVYRLVQETGLAPTVAYRIAKPDREVKRVDGGTLDTLCRVLRVTPGELLEYVEIPARAGRGRKR